MEDLNLSFKGDWREMDGKEDYKSIRDFVGVHTENTWAFAGWVFLSLPLLI